MNRFGTNSTEEIDEAIENLKPVNTMKTQTNIR